MTQINLKGKSVFIVYEVTYPGISVKILLQLFSSYPADAHNNNNHIYIAPYGITEGAGLVISKSRIRIQIAAECNPWQVVNTHATVTKQYNLVTANGR